MESVVSGELEVLCGRPQPHGLAAAPEAHEPSAAARPRLAAVLLGGTLCLGDSQPVDLCKYLVHRVPRSVGSKGDAASIGHSSRRVIGGIDDLGLILEEDTALYP